jgi:hypothetical protein
LQAGHCTVLYCTVLYCTVLYYSGQYPHQGQRWRWIDRREREGTGTAVAMWGPGGLARSMPSKERGERKGKERIILSSAAGRDDRSFGARSRTRRKHPPGGMQREAGAYISSCRPLPHYIFLFPRHFGPPVLDRSWKRPGRRAMRAIKIKRPPPNQDLPCCPAIRVYVRHTQEGGGPTSTGGKVSEALLVYCSTRNAV